MTIRILSALLLVLSFSADASIRLIGRGGGYAEMQALTALAKLKNYLAPCIQDRKLCGLSEENHKVLVEVEKLGLLNTSHARLEFFTSTASGDVFRFNEYDGSYLAINTHALYTPDGKPGNYSSILSTVFAAWFSRPPVLEHLQSLMPGKYINFFYLFDYIFRTVNVNETDLTLSNGTIFREIRIFMNGKTDVLVALEKPDMTVDLTPSFRKMLPCTSGVARLVEVTNFSQEGEYVVGRARWTCDEGQTRDARFHMKYHFAKEKNSIEFLTLQVVNMTEISAPTECEKKLGAL